MKLDCLSKISETPGLEKCGLKKDCLDPVKNPAYDQNKGGVQSETADVGILTSSFLPRPVN